MESLNCRCVGATFLTAAQLRKWNASECEGTNHALPSRTGNPRHTRGWLGPKGAQGLGNMPALRLSALGSMSGGVCGAAAVLAQALLAAARGAARQRLGASAGDARLGVAVGVRPGEDGVDVQDKQVLPLLSASAAAEGTVALEAAALAGATALPPLTLALEAGLSVPLRLDSVFAMASPPPLPSLLASAGLAAAFALSAAERLRGAVRPGLPERLVPRPPFLLGPRECTHDVVSMLATPRRDARIRRRVQHIVPAPLVAPF